MTIIQDPREFWKEEFFSEMGIRFSDPSTYRELNGLVERLWGSKRVDGVHFVFKGNRLELVKLIVESSQYRELRDNHPLRTSIIDRVRQGDLLGGADIDFDKTRASLKAFESRLLKDLKQLGGTHLLVIFDKPPDSGEERVILP